MRAHYVSTDTCGEAITFKEQNLVPYKLYKSLDTNCFESLASWSLGVQIYN